MLSVKFLLLYLVTFTTAVVLRTSERWIVDTSGRRVKLRCVNWAGHQEVNIPEGLQHQSVSTIAQWIANNRFNCVRLTFSTDMALYPTSVQNSFNQAAGLTGVSLAAMQNLYTSAVSKNPWLSSATTQSAFARVIDELASRNIMVILDNHVSKASWCCGTSDGNGWWSAASGYDWNNSRYFEVNTWLQGLRNMASFARSHANVVGIGLRNELRAVGSQDGNNHADWYNFLEQGARAVSDTNRDLLIIFGGTNYATDLGFLYSKPFNRSPFGDKIVYEFHNYQWTYGDRSCTEHQRLIGNAVGYLLATGKSYTGPLWLSEFGWNQNSASSLENNYATCLVQYMEGNDADWAYWALQGSYYVREGKVNFDESFGLMNSDWSGWRNSGFSGRLGKMWDKNQGP